MINYKGYSGLMMVDPEEGVISGRVLGIRDVVTFEGDTVVEAVQAFKDSVDDYLVFCAEQGVAPDKPFSGKFVVRIPPSLHRTLVFAAEARGTSLNTLVEETLSSAMRTLRPEARPPEPVGDPAAVEPADPAVAALLRKRGAAKAEAKSKPQPKRQARKTKTPAK